jgi:hypothetical protein
VILQASRSVPSIACCCGDGKTTRFNIPHRWLATESAVLSIKSARTFIPDFVFLVSSRSRFAPDEPTEPPEGSGVEFMSRDSASGSSTALLHKQVMRRLYLGACAGETLQMRPWLKEASSSGSTAGSLLNSRHGAHISHQRLHVASVHVGQGHAALLHLNAVVT